MVCGSCGGDDWQSDFYGNVYCVWCGGTPTREEEYEPEQPLEDLEIPDNIILGEE